MNIITCAIYAVPNVSIVLQLSLNYSSVRMNSTFTFAITINKVHYSRHIIPYLLFFLQDSTFSFSLSSYSQSNTIRSVSTHHSTRISKSFIILHYKPKVIIIHIHQPTQYGRTGASGAAIIGSMQCIV